MVLANPKKSGPFGSDFLNHLHYLLRQPDGFHGHMYTMWIVESPLSKGYTYLCRLDRRVSKLQRYRPTILNTQASTADTLYFTCKYITEFLIASWRRYG